MWPSGHTPGVLAKVSTLQAPRTLDRTPSVLYTYVMTTKRKRPQAQKSRSLDTLAMLTDPRGGKRGQVPSGTVYKRAPKHKGRGFEE